MQIPALGARAGVAAINPKKISGNWVSGYALDLHTLSSIHVGVNEFGHDVFDTKRSELGELLYRLKYNGDRTAAAEIIAAAVAFVKPSLRKIDLIVPVPPSGARAVQPVVSCRRTGSAAHLACRSPIASARPGHRHSSRVSWKWRGARSCWMGSIVWTLRKRGERTFSSSTISSAPARP